MGSSSGATGASSSIVMFLFSLLFSLGLFFLLLSCRVGGNGVPGLSFRAKGCLCSSAEGKIGTIETLAQGQRKNLNSQKVAKRNKKTKGRRTGQSSKAAIQVVGLQRRPRYVTGV